MPTDAACTNSEIGTKRRSASAARYCSANRLRPKTPRSRPAGSVAPVTREIEPTGEDRPMAPTEWSVLLSFR